MTDFTAEQLSRLAGGRLQRSIAKDVWPDGAVLQCKRCGYSERITTEQAGAYLASGWPKHCGATMKCEAAAAPPAGQSR